jgi:hypothetical protein
MQNCLAVLQTGLSYVPNNVRQYRPLLWYKKFRHELEQGGFEFNPYDPCVANREKNGSQQTLLFHVDDLKSSHKDPRVNDKFEQWLQSNYSKHGKVVNHCGKVHEYLGMEIDYCKGRSDVPSKNEQNSNLQ